MAMVFGRTGDERSPCVSNPPIEEILMQWMLWGRSTNTASVSGTISVWMLSGIGETRNRETSTPNSISRSVTQTGTASPRIIPKRLGGFKHRFGRECGRLFTCWVGSIDLGRVLKKMRERVFDYFPEPPSTATWTPCFRLDTV